MTMTMMIMIMTMIGCVGGWAAGIYPGVKTTELDNLAAETAAYMSTQHPDYAKLAARIAVSNLHKETRCVAVTPDVLTVLTGTLQRFVCGRDARSALVHQRQERPERAAAERRGV